MIDACGPIAKAYVYRLYNKPVNTDMLMSSSVKVSNFTGDYCFVNYSLNKNTTAIPHDYLLIYTTFVNKLNKFCSSTTAGMNFAFFALYKKGVIL